MRRELSGSMVFDTGVLLELLLSTPGGLLVREKLLRGELFGYVTELALVEARYVLCRRVGWEEASKRVDWLVLSGFIEVEDVSSLCERAAKFKCEVGISLPDCFTLSLADLLSMPALFARRERELVGGLSKLPPSINVLFLEDFIENVSGLAPDRRK